MLGSFTLENEVRIAYLLDRITAGRPIDTDRMWDPVRHDAVSFRALEARRLGPAGPDAAAARSVLPPTAMGRPRLDAMHAALDALRVAGVAGDFVDVRPGAGGGSAFLRGYLRAHELATPTIWVADEFRAGAAAAPSSLGRADEIDAMGFDLNRVRDTLARFGLLDDRVRFLQGPPAELLGDAAAGRTRGVHASRPHAGRFDPHGARRDRRSTRPRRAGVDRDRRRSRGTGCPHDHLGHSDRPRRW